MLAFLSEHLPSPSELRGKFIEPFVGGGAVYFHLQPKRALLADLNLELIDLYRALQTSPERVWAIYRTFPTTKKAYKKIRDWDDRLLTPLQNAARLLYLNRTCFKGMWRHNLDGKFNVGYGGQSRRWCLQRKDLLFAGSSLKSAKLACSDFQPVIAHAQPDDFLFLDPPYRPGEREQIHDHYIGRRFSFQDHCRLAECLVAAHKRRVGWALTISNHSDIVRLYRNFSITPIPRGTGAQIGAIAARSGEVLITNSRSKAK